MSTSPQPQLGKRLLRCARSGSVCWFATVCAVFVACGGCASPLSRWAQRTFEGDAWLADYDTAEEHARESGRDMLIVYLNDRPGIEQALERTLKSERFEQLPQTYTCCTLVRSYEPDRRYVGQFGVNRAPAMILVHPDGTYHSAVGTLTADETIDFLAEARSQGETAHVNPYVPRVANYQWLKSLDEAVAASRVSGRAMLAVFYRPYTRDWWRMRKLLSTHEVYLRLGDLVHARIGEFSASAPAAITRFGALRLPALVIAHPSGSFEALEEPASADGIVRFADAALRSAQRSAPSVAEDTAKVAATPAP